MELSQTEENYLKTIFNLTWPHNRPLNTNAIAADLDTTAASVTAMLKRLDAKDLLHYVKYKGVILTEQGKSYALGLVRKHRLWEVFLVDKLKMSWDEVHEVAEQLEHIRSPLLISRLDDFLGHPKFDPHGDPIPDKAGNMAQRDQELLASLEVGDSGIMLGVKEHSPSFLQYLESNKLLIGELIKVESKIEFDQSLVLKLRNKSQIMVSKSVANNIFVKKQS